MVNSNNSQLQPTLSFSAPALARDRDLVGLSDERPGMPPRNRAALLYPEVA